MRLKEHMVLSCRALMARASGGARMCRVLFGAVAWLGSVNKFTESSRRAVLSFPLQQQEAAPSCGGVREHVGTNVMLPRFRKEAGCSGRVARPKASGTPTSKGLME